ncbi:hypothetical protein L1889_17500 [Paenalcaligenes niemegkensis]|uniref:hypothetical protein n=1 Tax=Paenalcaligenes niemegkensis TaxID=2895469 RepID=UPI001EE9469A|nr:hypothetical protein [Paenalcaligenes niemegkensis]MCQ9618251.1 hypothetical protein [Paenalcaligenes niemegkensis]
MIGNKFIPIVDYMSFDEYNSYMACIDVAIFNHDRQQAMGNIIGLLSLGKKVVLKSTITPYKFFSDIGLNIYELSDDELLKKLPKEIRERNINLMRDYFNDERLRSNWEEVFHG